MCSIAIINKKIAELEFDKKFKQYKCYKELYGFLCNERHKYCYLCERAKTFMFTKRIISLDSNDSNNNNNNNSNTTDKQQKGDGPNRYGTLTNTKLKGLRPLLKQVFWPEYKYVKQKYHYGTGVTSTDEGIERGKLIHEQLCDYANLTPKRFERAHPMLHTYTKKAIIWMEENKILPIIAELIVYDEHSYYGTAADLIAIQKTTGQLIYIEWKSGGDHYKNTGTAPLKGCLGKKFSDTPQNQAFIQALITLELMKLKYNLCNITGFVAFIDLSGVEAKPIPDEMIEMRDDVCDDFYKYLNEKNSNIDKIKRRSKKHEKLMDKLNGVEKKNKKKTKETKKGNQTIGKCKEKQVKKGKTKKAIEEAIPIYVNTKSHQEIGDLDAYLELDLDEPIIVLDSNKRSDTEKKPVITIPPSSSHNTVIINEGEDEDDILLPIEGISDAYIFKNM